MTTPEKNFLKKITDVSNVPFAMAVLNDKGEITEYGPYQVEFAHEIPHIPLYTTPQTKPLSDSELIVFLMDDIDKASQWLVEGQTHMAIGVLGQCHAEIRKHLGKKSKPLSDEEINKIADGVMVMYGVLAPLEFAWAIEERHGIK